MNHWLMIVPKSSWAKESVSSLMIDRVLPRLTMKPAGICLHQLDDFSVLFAAWANAKLFSYEQPVFTAKEECCVVSGLPTLESYAGQSEADIPQTIATLLKDNGAADLYFRLGGNWNFGYSNQSEITVLASFSGYFSCVYFENDDFFAVGNRASLLTYFTNRAGKEVLSTAVLSWLFSTTMILGHQSPYWEIKKIPPGSFLSYRKDEGVTIKEFSPNFYTPLSFKNEAEREEYIRDTVERLSRRMSWYVERKIPLAAHLTGGKDTRAILGLLLRGGAIEKVEQIITSGEEENGDVILARRIAKEFGIAAKHTVRKGNKQRGELDLEKIKRNFAYCPFKYEGHLTPHDGTMTAANTLSSVVTLMGGGGEIYRQKEFKNYAEHDLVFRQFLDWSYTYDALRILSKEALHAQHNFLREETRVLLEQGIVNHQPKFYIDHRLSNWGAAHMQNNASCSLAVLPDIQLTRLMFSSPEMGENIHFEIMRLCDARLLQIPFLNDQWKGATAEKAKALGVYLPPFFVPQEINFPWQFQFFRAFRNELLDIAIESSEHFADLISPQALIALKSQAVEPFDSAQIKMLYGLVMASVMVRSAPRGPRDFENCQDTSFSGNLAESLRENFPHAADPSLNDRSITKAFEHISRRGKVSRLLLHCRRKLLSSLIVTVRP